MSFSTDLEDRRGSGTGSREFRKPVWFFPRPGNYIIRILQKDYVSKYAHWIPTGKGKGTTIECLGRDECPVCHDNARIIGEYPETFRNVPGFNPYHVTCYVNILDKTQVKVCPT